MSKNNGPANLDTTPPTLISVVPRLALIVDDNPLIREMLSLAFKDAGFSVVIAADGREAIEVAAVMTPDIILMDLKMPVLDGLEATRILRASAHLAHVPVVAFTGMPIDTHETRDLFVAVLQKPMAPSEVIRKVTLVLAIQPSDLPDHSRPADFL